MDFVICLFAGLSQKIMFRIFVCRGKEGKFMPVSGDDSSAGIFSVVSIQNVGDESFMSREFMRRAFRII